ncbi:MAG: glycosyltransferase family 4 protein [Patescibacteria group bacterium]|nr:glycosyltransferase family 4 protein [Patescibacteria group bacterium]
MKIAVLAPAEESVPPKKYGGTEVVVYNLVTELHRMGHSVTLFASGDSKVPCRLISTFETSVRTTYPYSIDLLSRDKAKIVVMSKALKHLLAEKFDILHNHMGWRFNPFAELLSYPMVTTLHGPPGSLDQRMIHSMYPNQYFVSISNNQRRSFPELLYIDTVYNGIDVDLYPFQDKPSEEQYLLFLARFSPEKGPKEAIEIAQRTGRKLKMAVKVDQVDKEFFESCKSLLEKSNVDLIGEVGIEEKVRLLQHAYALLAPIQWEEPFGLFVVEAMACGTPVIGMRRGSFPEIISHGVNGFLGDTVDELASYVDKISTIDRRVCRRTVEERFTKTRMAEEYIKVYQDVIRRYSDNSSNS